MRILDAVADLFTPRPALRQPPDVEHYTTTTLGDPADWIVEGLGDGKRAFTGEILTKRGAEALPAVWACKLLLEAAVGMVPLDAYRRLDGSGRKKATDTAQHRLTRLRPNPYLPPMAFYGMLMFHKLSYGDAYISIERDGDVRNATEAEVRRMPIKALWPLLSDRTRCRMFEGVKICQTTVREEDGSTKRVTLLPGEYCHIPSRGFNGLRSYSPLEFGTQPVALGLAQIEWSGKFYDGDAHAAAWVKLPQIPGVGKAWEKKIERVRDVIRSQHPGLRAPHRFGILPEGAELQKSIVTPQEQELVEERNLSGYEVCRLFNVKPHKVALMDRATFTNIESQDLSWMGDCVMPHTEMISQVFDYELWPIEQQTRYFFAWNYKARLRSTPREEAEVLKIAVGAPWMTAEEAREKQDENPLPGDQRAGQLLRPVNMVESGQDFGGDGGTDARVAAARRMMGLEPQIVTTAKAAGALGASVTEQRQARSATARNRLRIAHLPIFVRSAEKYIRLEVKRLRSYLSKHGEDLRAFTAEANQFLEQQLPEAILRELGPVMSTFGAVIADAIAEELDAQVAGAAYDVAVEGVTAAAVARHIRKSRGALAGIMSDHAGSAPDAVEAIGLRLDQWLEARAPKVAASESVRAGGRLAQEAYAAGGVREKRWVSFGGCPLCQSLDGQVVGISGTFLAAGDTVEGEGVEPLTVDRSTFHPPLHTGCSCAITGA